MNRRVFLKVTGVVAAAGAVQALPSAGSRSTGVAPAVQSSAVETVMAGPAGTPLTVREAGTYRISGLVRLQEPRVEIAGFTYTQSISWSDKTATGERLSSFTAFEHFDSPDVVRTISVKGGQLESMTAVLLDDA